MDKATTRTQLEQGRANFAYKCAEAGKKLQKPSEYKSYVKKIPMLIKTNGLGATLAFIFSKSTESSGEKINKKKTYGLIYSQIEDWLKKDEKRLIEFGEGKIAEEVTNIPSGQYRAITIEILAFFNWLRRFSDALIGDDEK